MALEELDAGGDLLGSVDNHASHMTAAVIATKEASEFVVAGSDATELLDAAEKALDQVTVLVVIAIETALDTTMAARRDDGLDALIGEMLEDGIGIVGLVRTERRRL